VPPADETPPAAEAPSAAGVRAGRPVVTVTGETGTERPMRVVERALRSQSSRPDGWRDRVVVVPGGHRPGKPDQLQRDRARARLPVSGPRRIVVLGCTRGAGQTTTVLLAGDMLASLREEPVAVLDLNPGRNSLTEQAAAIPGLVADPLDAPRLVPGGAWSQAGGPPGNGGPPSSGTGLQVISGNSAPDSGDAGRVIDAVARRYRLTLADPAAGCVPRTLEVADQLMIVAPASAEAANALGMTFEWLDAHGYGRLATAAVTILNGVSGPTAGHAERAANVANGRCRAIVKVPWDSHLKDIARDRMPYRGAPARDRRTDGAPTILAAPTEPPPRGAHPAGAQPAGPRAASLLSPALTSAYTALAGVLVAGLTDHGDARSAR
jgi:MinD-like ATPase involved in chromosome partitioning or flagellar assembly